jgi:2-dehydro-3-deoxyphosphogluconate aldolase/(4S)-4-hydroxy-2-oxoglutarate aldolase
MYLAAGASFIVAPNLDADVARLCNGRKIPYLPGCASVSEIQQAHVLGVEICKLFPAAEVGGPAFVKNLRGPLPWAEIMPAGGVAPTRESLASWFDVGVACVGMGSGLFAPELLAKRDYAGIVARIENVIALIRDVRRAG